jgi:hypothetical protein
MRRIFIILTVFAALAMSIPAFAEEMLPPDPALTGDFSSQYMGERVLVDFFVLRPLGFAAGLIGLGSAVVMSPMAVETNSMDRVCRELVQKPFSYTFQRPLGDINF